MKDDNHSSYIERLKSDNTAVGVFSAKQTCENKTEISYILSPAARGKGLATEAVLGLERICKKCTDVSAFTAQIHIDNTLSIKLIKRLSYIRKERAGDFIMYQKEIKKEQ